MIFFGVLGVPEEASLTFLADYTSTDTSISGVSFGAASATRRVFVTIGWRGVAAIAQTISSATIGGVAATIHVQGENRHTGTDTTIGAAIISALVPTGTSGTVAFSVNTGAVGNAHIGSFRGVALSGSSPTSTASDSANELTKPATGVLNVPSVGFIILTAAMTGPNDLSLSAVGSTSAYLDGITLEAGARYRTGMSADASYDVSATWTSGDAGLAMAALSWDMV